MISQKFGITNCLQKCTMDCQNSRAFKKLRTTWTPFLHQFHDSDNDNSGHGDITPDLDIVSFECKLALSEFLITQYHQQSMNKGCTLHEFVNNKCAVLQELYNKQNVIKNKEKLSKSLINYIEWYQNNIYKPLPNCGDYEEKSTEPLILPSIKHDIDVVFQYLTEINDALYGSKYLKDMDPLQLDVFFIPPSSSTAVTAIHDFCDGIKALKCDKTTECDGNVCSGAHGLLRRAKKELELAPGDCVKMIIIRGDPEHSNYDTIYLFKSKNRFDGAILDFAKYSALPWFNNTKSDIIPGLNAQSNGILTISHHLHSHQSERVYASIGNYGSRVFKHDFLNCLPVLFGEGFNKITGAIKKDFKKTFDAFGKGKNADFRDLEYQKYGQYLFGPMRYECFNPIWNSVNPRAMHNVHISKPTTTALRPYIQEHFANNTALYYYLDYQFAMQFVNGGMTYYNFYKMSAKGVLIINTELHHEQSGDKLYAICVKNDHNYTKQRWRIWGDHNGSISNSFMTKSEICKIMSINAMDIPISSLNLQAMSDDIDVDDIEYLVTTSFYKWNLARVIQSRAKRNVDVDYDGDLEISCSEFQNKVIAAFNDECNPLIPIIFFPNKKRKCEFHMEKLLLVEIQRNQWIAVTFRFNQDMQRTEVSSICLDLLDCKNKSALADPRNGIIFDEIMEFDNAVRSLDVYEDYNNNLQFMPRMYNNNSGSSASSSYSARSSLTSSPEIRSQSFNDNPFDLPQMYNHSSCNSSISNYTTNSQRTGSYL